MTVDDVLITVDIALPNIATVGDTVYDLQGRVISRGQQAKGVYISNGRKYVVK